MTDWIEITDFTAPCLDIYARLSEAQLRHYDEPYGGLFLAETLTVIERAFDAGCEPVSLLLERRLLSDLRVQTLMDRLGDIPVYTADQAVLRELTGFPLTRGALCAMRRPVPGDVRHVCKGARRIAVLENVMNPTNVGAIFRSAAALSMDAVLLTEACSDPLYRRAIRVSMGTVFQIPWTYLKNSWEKQSVTASEISCSKHPNGCKAGQDEELPCTYLDVLKEMGFVTVSMALDEKAIRIDDKRLMDADRLAVVLGSEGDGLSSQTIAACDYTVCIPMSHGVDSLNVAAASAVAFWQLGKQ